MYRDRDGKGATGALHPQNFEILLNKTSPKLETYEAMAAAN